jgi:hypothetical protein
MKPFTLSSFQERAYLNLIEHQRIMSWGFRGRLKALFYKIVEIISVAWRPPGR